MTRYTREAMSALAYLHDNMKMVHCDLKPKNILLSIDGRIKTAATKKTRPFGRSAQPQS